MNEVKVIGMELLGSGRVAFPFLEVLSFGNMSGLAVWLTNSGVNDAVLPRLQELVIYNCPKLVDMSLEALPSLRTLGIGRCGDGVLRNMVRVGSSVTQLAIQDISGLSDEVWRGVIKNLGAVEAARVDNCNEIRYLWESEEDASKFLVNLRRLSVKNCSQLVRLGEKEEDRRSDLLTSLRLLELTDCDSLKDCSCPSSIQTLEIISCSSIACVSFPIGGMQKLKTFEIRDCKELVMPKEMGGGENTNNTMLLEILDIRNWPNLKSIDVLLSCYSIHLTTLVIADCENMETFPDLVLPNLTSLTHLGIVGCPRMRGSFPRGYWPPNLCGLVIGGLKKPISKWGSQNFPTSLVVLTLTDRLSDDDVSNLSRLSPHHLLPSNLTSLKLVGFKNPETVSMGLQHLTSLQHLQFKSCPNLTDLPEKLLPSLLSLTMDECPKLKEKTSKSGGSGSFNYWPKVSHIPCINIDEELQS